jgi:hypothetical protein
MPKLGDTKACRLCGETAELKRIPAATATFSGPGAITGHQVPEQVVWECTECDDREPFNDNLDEA